MKRTDKVRRIQAILDELHPQPAVPLAHRDPFTLLVAVLLSAQTSDARVNQVSPALFARAPTPAALAALSEAEILALIRTLGLAPTKAKHLRQLAAELVLRHEGRVPERLAELEALPGVGHKTASVVLVQAFGQEAFPVDTHIHRLAARWGLSDGSSVARTERDLKRLFPPESWGKVHLQIILFGRRHCPALRHDLDSCPICSFAASKRRRELERRRGRPGRAASTRTRDRTP